MKTSKLFKILVPSNLPLLLIGIDMLLILEMLIVIRPTFQTIGDLSFCHPKQYLETIIAGTRLFFSPKSLL